jgi:formylglycine-generating enzyme
MIPPRFPLLSLVAIAGTISGTPALAVVNIDFVSVGNAGNASDTANGNLYGAVAYAYQIARNETTISQYAAFLNEKAKTDPYSLYHTDMASIANVAGITRSGVSGSYAYFVVQGSGNHPIANVTWFDAARFTNWLNNGQGSGSTETGAYTLNGAMTGVFSKNVGATVWLPSENEWYKAAYYDPTKGASGGYWKYATQSDILVTNTIGAPGAANFNDGDYVGSGSTTIPTGNALTDVGAYGANSDSYYGTNDQTGNLFEWTDGVGPNSMRTTRGGNWYADFFPQGSNYRANFVAPFTAPGLGFRVAGVPEPSSPILTILAGGVVFARRKR